MQRDDDTIRQFASQFMPIEAFGSDSRDEGCSELAAASGTLEVGFVILHPRRGAARVD